MKAGWLQLDGWHGRTQQEVEIVGETSQRVRIRALTKTMLAGRRGYLAVGAVALVPCHAVRAEQVPGVAVVEF
ncbi:MAG: hypothetical protein JO110_14640 [Acetobacteraceae bacterium]|nr:hypothetical protein [Acetobacteraceae bacterium]